MLSNSNFVTSLEASTEQFCLIKLSPDIDPLMLNAGHKINGTTTKSRALILLRLRRYTDHVLTYLLTYLPTTYIACNQIFRLTSRQPPTGLPIQPALLQYCVASDELLLWPSAFHPRQPESPLSCFLHKITHAESGRRKSFLTDKGTLWESSFLFAV